MIMRNYSEMSYNSGASTTVLNMLVDICTCFGKLVST